MYVAVAEYNIASPDGILTCPSTVSDEIKAAYGSHQSFKTCNSADELAVKPQTGFGLKLIKRGPATVPSSDRITDWLFMV